MSGSFCCEGALSLQELLSQVVFAEGHLVVFSDQETLKAGVDDPGFPLFPFLLVLNITFLGQES